jgi:ABC-type multidrug transport system permease subunit
MRTDRLQLIANLVAACVNLIAVCILLSYIIPTLVERFLVGLIGPLWAYLVLGDAIGCAAIGFLTRWKLGLGLYVALTAVEAFLFHYRVVSLGALSWIVDAVPTLLLCALIGVMVHHRWRRMQTT